MTVNESDSVDAVIAALRDNGISQVPVVDGTGKPTGIVHEVDILRGLQDGSVQSDTKIGTIAHEIGGVLHPKARVEELYGIFETDHVAIVIDGNQIMGVVSKIDLIEHLTKLNA